MIEAFHVTTEKALPGILEAGLLPQIGERSAQLGESEPAVFLFSSFEMVSNLFTSASRCSASSSMML